MSADLPKPPAQEAFDGLAGDLVAAFDPHTEADPAAVLIQTLALAGCMVGVRPHVMVGAEAHRPRLFVAVVGVTGRGRKGTSLSGPLKVAVEADPTFAGQMRTGLASGEALIAEVRDEHQVWDEKKQAWFVKEPGVRDKRLLVRASEFAQLLRTMRREGNIISPVLREAWDTGALQVTARTTGVKATGAHIAVIAHCTPDELRREMPDADGANGFANRFIYVSAGRSKLLPAPEPFEGEVVLRLARKLAAALEAGKYVTAMRRDTGAEALWADVYPALTADRPGLAGAVLARGEAQVLRLSMIYCLLDGSDTITTRHLRSALALWDYADRSVMAIFGDRVGDALADTIRDLISKTPGQRKTDIHTALGRNYAAGRIDAALRTLTDAGLARSETEATGGRPAERWYPVMPPHLLSSTSFSSYRVDEVSESPTDEVVGSGEKRDKSHESSGSTKHEINEVSEESPAVPVAGPRRPRATADPDDGPPRRGDSEDVDHGWEESLAAADPPVWLEELAEVQT